MACGCRKQLNGFERGTVTGYTLTSEDGCLLQHDGRCVVFPSPEAAEMAAIEQGFVEWRLTAITV